MLSDQSDQDVSRGVRLGRAKPGVGVWGWGVIGGLFVGGLLVGAVPAAGRAQVAASAVRDAPPLVLDGVTVVDVDGGKLVRDQRVVIAGHRIRTMGDAKTVAVPRGAKVVRAQGKYLMPGLWDFHFHTSSDLAYPLLIANGVTGFRDASALTPIDTMRQWQREILAGTRVGPPRQLLSGAAIDEGDIPGVCHLETSAAHICVPRGDTVAMRRLVDSLQTAGVDMLKLYAMSRQAWFFFAREARRRGLRFGGHTIPPFESDEIRGFLNNPTDSAGMQRFNALAENVLRTAKAELDMADSGASIIDHEWGALWCAKPDGFDVCRRVAAGFRRTGMWAVPTAYGQSGSQGPNGKAIAKRYHQWALQAKSSGTLPSWLRDSLRPTWSPADSSGPSALAERAGLPVLAGTDVTDVPPLNDAITGFAAHVELAMVVADGMTPLHALQTATLNPAKFLNATDSLGTVAPGKLADLILLDADPLADITNTMRIRAVVANGRYYDRATLDRFLAEYLTQRKRGFRAWRYDPAIQGSKRMVDQTIDNVWGGP